LLKDSVPCPIPNLENEAIARPLSNFDITHGVVPFNNHREARMLSTALSGWPVAQMTRFEPRR
jgi:hypothetical protein